MLDWFRDLIFLQFCFGFLSLWLDSHRSFWPLTGNSRSWCQQFWINTTPFYASVSITSHVENKKRHITHFDVFNIETMINYLVTNTFFSCQRQKGIFRFFCGSVRLLQSIKARQMIRGWWWRRSRAWGVLIFLASHICVGFPARGRVSFIRVCKSWLRGPGFNLGTMLCVANVIFLWPSDTFISNVGIYESQRDPMRSLHILITQLEERLDFQTSHWGELIGCLNPQCLPSPFNLWWRPLLKIFAIDQIWSWKRKLNSNLHICQELNQHEASHWV